MITGLHHAQITIPEGREDEARAFYCDLLELPEIPKPESLRGRGGFWVQVGSMTLHIGTEPGVDRHATKAHLAYQVLDIEHWRSLIEGQNISIVDGIPIPGFKRFEFRDPFGNRIEMIQPVERTD